MEWGAREGVFVGWEIEGKGGGRKKEAEEEDEFVQGKEDEKKEY